MAAALFTGSLARRLVQYAIAGTAGNLVVRGAERLRPYAGPAARRASVRVIAAGIVGGRKLGDAAEEARLQTGDLLAEARASLGESAPTPGAAAASAPAPDAETATAAEPGAPRPRAAATTKPAPRKAAPRKRRSNDDHGHEH